MILGMSYRHLVGLVLLVGGGSLPLLQAFTTLSASSSSFHAASTTTCSALTPRKKQFWEDVADGLHDMEDFHQKQGTGDIDRVWAFCRSAQGKTPKPQPARPGQEPSEEHIEGLTAQPFWDVATDTARFPWAAALEEKADIIQKEFEEKLLDTSRFASDSVWQNQVMGGGWSAIRLQRLGVWNTENCAEFPETYAILKELKIPLAVRGVCFARQAPGTGVQPHSDGRNFILTAHLGLKIPDKCWIEVGGERRGWEQGKLTTLDTSFVHSTGNPSPEEDRHVLIIDFWHPELSAPETAALEFIYDLRNRFESGLVPFRKPRTSIEDEEEEGMGLVGLWQSLTGSGGK